MTKLRNGSISKTSAKTLLKGLGSQVIPESVNSPLFKIIQEIINKGQIGIGILLGSIVDDEDTNLCEE